MDISLSGVALHVADVERSLSFYRLLPDSSVLFQVPGRFALLQIGSGRLALLHDEKRRFHLEFDCTDLDATYSKLTEFGIRTEGPPKIQPWGERDFMLLDPDGNLVQFSQRRKPIT